MDNIELIKNTSFNLSSVAHCRLGVEWNYRNVISSFTRLYLITEGEAIVYIWDRKIKLKKGYLYLIPSFANCSYICLEYMEQFYATFSIHLPNDMSIYQLFNLKTEVKAEPLHYNLFKKLLEENQGMALPYENPREYQKRIKLGIQDTTHHDAKSVLTSNGLLNLLISDFIGSTRMDLSTVTHNRISESIKYIHQHLGENIRIDHLAERSCLSPDHFTRKFKELTNQTPLDYINRQRIEKAQLLINTTPYSITEIAYQCGFSDNTYFYKVFKKYVKQSPTAYKHHNTINDPTL